MLPCGCFFFNVWLLDIFTLYLYGVVKTGFPGLQIDTVSHPVTVKMTYLWTVMVETVKYTLQSFIIK